MLIFWYDSFNKSLEFPGKMASESEAFIEIGDGPSFTGTIWFDFFAFTVVLMITSYARYRFSWQMIKFEASYWLKDSINWAKTGRWSLHFIRLFDS